MEILQGRPEGTVKKYQGELRHIYASLDTIIPFESPLTWLREKWPEVVAHILQQNQTRRHTQFAMISGVSKNRDMPLYNAASELQREHPARAPTGELNPREESNWVDFKDLKAVAKRYDAKVAAMKAPLSTENITTLYQHLMLCMCTDMPPMRNEPSEMRIVNDLQQATDQENVLQCLPKGKYLVHLRKFKTVGRYGEKTLDLPVKVERAITRSLKLLPREWLLTLIRDTSKPLGTVGMSTIFATVLPDKKLGSSIARKIYLSHVYRNDKSWAERERLAGRMQHSAATAGSFYQKTCPKKPR